MVVCIICMGVSGSGKTTVGSALANFLGCKFVDADDFHSPESVLKMSHGHPLTDEDREPWLQSIRLAMEEWNRQLDSQEKVVIACSALKRRYRETLRGRDSVALPVQFVWLDGSMDLINERMQNRHHHFMKAEMLKSQFDALENPLDDISSDYPVIRVEIERGDSTLNQVQKIVKNLL